MASERLGRAGSNRPSFATAEELPGAGRDRDCTRIPSDGAAMIGAGCATSSQPALASSGRLQRRFCGYWSDSFSRSRAIPDYRTAAKGPAAWGVLARSSDKAISSGGVDRVRWRLPFRCFGGGRSRPRSLTPASLRQV